MPKLNIKNYICEDKFSPHDNSCYQIDLKKVQVDFIDSIEKWTIFKIFQKY